MTRILFTKWPKSLNKSLSYIISLFTQLTGFKKYTSTFFSEVKDSTELFFRSVSPRYVTLCASSIFSLINHNDRIVYIDFIWRKHRFSLQKITVLNGMSSWQLDLNILHVAIRKLFLSRALRGYTINKN